MKPVTFKFAAILACAFAAVTTREISAQILGPLLPESAMELGARVRWINADMHSGESSSEFHQYDVTVPIRYGVTRFATLSADLMIGTEKLHALDYELRYYTLGGGFQALVWEKDAYLVSAGFHFAETLIIDRSGDHCDREQVSLLAIIQLQRAFEYQDQEIVVWGGGVQFYFSEDTEAGNNCRPADWTNSATLGIAMGTDVVLFDHFDIYYQFIYVDCYQPRVGLSFRF